MCKTPLTIFMFFTRRVGSDRLGIYNSDVHPKTVKQLTSAFVPVSRTANPWFVALFEETFDPRNDPSEPFRPFHCPVLMLTIPLALRDRPWEDRFDCSHICLASGAGVQVFCSPMCQRATSAPGLRRSACRRRSST